MIKILNIFSISCFLILLFPTILLAQKNIIPMPVELIKGEGKLDLRHGIYIKKNNENLFNEYALLDDLFKNWKINLVKKVSKKNIPVVVLNIDENYKGKDEAYSLSINKDLIQINAKTNKGIFYAIQTLKQFEIQNQKLDFVQINDSPAFSWRAYLIDVGRNYQPVEMIKEQIDIMAKYKLNILHFHFTEDIAWRLESKKYPGLTDANVMTRWKGDYYTEQDFKEIIRYCKEKYINLLPEIDMPGHSAAFERFFGVDMQSDSGIVYIKELLKEFKDTYPDLDDFHIGGDEVKITNKNFMPDITKFVENLGYKRTIGWDPGSNLEPQTIRQMWMGGPKIVKEEGDIIYIESKHLYINHMDPLETVTTLFHRMVGETPKEHKNFIGATLCSWPDRAVAKAEDMFLQSAIYPGMITFAERIWRGGGKNNWISNILPKNDPDYIHFVDYEDRLLHHKNKYFKNRPFPYVKQIGLDWKLIGPFDNEGDLAKILPIEEQNIFTDKIYKIVEGGTVVLKHWFGNIIESAVDNPQPNTTFYAHTKIWSNADTLKSFWIDFNNFSRSYLTDTPFLGTWDNKGSKVWVNGMEINPPKWKQAGQIAEREIPLIDEGYSFREPTVISLKKGWNNVLLKLPVKEFKGRTWENPVKWMFTFIPVEEEIN